MTFKVFSDTITVSKIFINKSILKGVSKKCVNNVFNIGGETYSLYDMANLIAAKYNVDIVFIQKGRNEYQTIFEDVKTVASACDDFVKQLRLFTEKQNIYNVEPKGVQKIILLKE